MSAKLVKPSENGTSFSHEWLKLSDLQAHPDIQRQFNRAHAEAIAAKFDPDSFGELYVVKDSRGYLIWDGQHRAYAARKALGEDQQVYCRVYHDEALATLAGRSLRLNTQKPWMPVDRYALRLKSEEWQARTIHGILHQYGLKVGWDSTDGTVAAVGACDWIIQKCGGPGTLLRVGGILFHAWGRDRNAYHNVLLRGLALVCARYDAKIEDAVLSDRLSKCGGPGRFVGRVRDRAKVDALTMPHAAASIMVNEYNKGRNAKNRVPAWVVA